MAIKLEPTTKMMGNSAYMEDDDPVEHETIDGSLSQNLFSNDDYACQDQVESPVPRVSQSSGPTTWEGHGYIEGDPRPPLPNPIWIPDHPIIAPNVDAMNDQLRHICGRPIGIGQALECHWPECSRRVCRNCMNRNINDFWALMESVWLAVCSDCKAFEGKRPHSDYVRRRCSCVLNPDHFKFPGAQSQFCLQHMYMRWDQIMRAARPEITRRRKLTYNEPRLIKKKGYESTKAANARRAENRRRTNEIVAAGFPLGMEVLNPAVMFLPQFLPRCPCGKKAGAGQHRVPTLTGAGRSNHFRTNLRDEIRSCAGCYSHYDKTTRQQDARSVFQGVLPLAIPPPGPRAHPLGPNYAMTFNCPKDERTGWVRRGDRFW